MYDVSLLPDPETGQLPEIYTTAKQTLATCYSMDECKSWADKAAALASYAKQAADDDLENMAKRIRGRAIRRCGELLKEVEAGKGGQPYQVKNPTRTGADTSRTQAAQEAGMSKRQKDTALRLATIPSQDFEAAIESDTPPTLTALAEMGIQKKEESFDYLQGRTWEDHRAWTPISGALGRFADDVVEAQFAAGIRGATVPEQERALREIATIRRLIDTLEQALIKAQKERLIDAA